jgi:hypothetical protein
VTHVDDFEESYRRAERALRDELFGDGVYTVGHVRGNEARDRVAREPRRMREAFTDSVGASQTRAEAAEERAIGLEEELRKIASARSRKRTKPSS